MGREGGEKKRKREQQGEGYDIVKKKRKKGKTPPCSAENGKFSDEKLRKQLPRAKKLQNVELEKPPRGDGWGTIKKRRRSCELKASAR